MNAESRPKAASDQRPSSVGRRPDGPMPPALRAALFYARFGKHVLPVYEIRDGACSCPLGSSCSSPGKHPRLRDGFKGATTDLAAIRGWFTANPEANLGVRTGPESGLLVVDIDVDKGGNDTTRDLAREHGQFFHGPTVWTGSGGIHLWFRHPAGDPIPCSASKLGPGVDIRAAGGYVVAPPSNHISGDRYSWVQDRRPGRVPLTPPPDWLVEQLRALSAPSKVVQARALHDRLPEQLATSAPPTYFRLLAGLEPNVAGKVRCPAHDDTNPSCHVYPDPVKGWHCFACGAGGTIIDLAAALWNIEPRGRGYHDILRRLEHELGLQTTA